MAQVIPLLLYRWRFHLVIIFMYTAYHDVCFGAKLERKQDFFDVEGFDSKRNYRLNEIGKRGFTSTLGFDYSGSSDYGIGATSALASDYSGSSRSATNEESLSPARDLIPPPAPGVYSSSTSPPSTKSDYSHFERIPFPSATNFATTLTRGPISRRSPHLQQTSLNSYFDDISPSAAASHGRTLSSGNFGLVADNEGKLIGYRGSILPGYTDSPPSIITSPSTRIPSDSSSFIGSYFPGPPSSPEYGKPKYALASSASSGSYASTPIYYPGREEDHTYRMRDTTSQGYDDDDEASPSLEDDFSIGGGTYQPVQLSPPPSRHYHALRESNGLTGRSNHHLDYSNRFLPFESADSPGPGFSYGPLGKTHQSSHGSYGRKRSFGPPSPSSKYGHVSSSLERERERIVPYSYTPLSYSDYISN